MTFDPESITSLLGLLAWILRQTLELMKSRITPKNLVFLVVRYFWSGEIWFFSGYVLAQPVPFLTSTSFETLDFSSQLQLNSALRVQQECCQWHPERNVERTNFNNSLRLHPLSPVLKYLESWLCLSADCGALRFQNMFQDFLLKLHISAYLWYAFNHQGMNHFKSAYTYG